MNKHKIPGELEKIADYLDWHEPDSAEEIREIAEKIRTEL